MFDEAKLIISNVNKVILVKIASFSIWNLFDLLSSVFKYSAMDVLINTFHGTLANAANAVSKQVSGSLLSFSSSIYSASRPQIVQAISRNNTEEAISKTITISRLGFVFMALFSIPLFVEMPIVLGMWLKSVPENAVPFCRLGLISNLVALMTVRGFSVLLDGIGRIKAFRLTTSLCNLIAFPAAYVFLRQGFPPYAIFLGILFSDVLQVLATVHFTVRYTDLTWERYFREIPMRLLPIVVGVVGFLFLLPWPVGMMSLLRLVCVTAISSLLLLVLFWFALSVDEKAFAKGLLAKLWARVQNPVS
jgi:O-antigen/teichoic acid export membrane protein